LLYWSLRTERGLFWTFNILLRLGWCLVFNDGAGGRVGFLFLGLFLLGQVNGDLHLLLVLLNFRGAEDLAELF
jgi:hypothetical protein